MYPMPRTASGLSKRSTSVSATTLPLMNLIEAALIERCKSGDADAWDTLIRRHQRSVYKFAYTLCHNPEDAADIAGHVFLQIYQKLHTFCSESSFPSWLFRIVRNAYIDMCVRPAYRGYLSLDTTPLKDGDSTWGHNLRDQAPLPEAVCLEKETAQLLTNAIRHLPAYQRVTLQMYHIEGKSYAEIVAATGLSLGTIKSRLNRARTMLRERLTPLPGDIDGRAARQQAQNEL